jgi:hypothetical protein
MAKSTGLGLLELPTMFELLKPDVVVSVGDRFETMSTAIAPAYMNIPVAHTMGGEISGTIDESIRHAVTKLAHMHFPANKARPTGSSGWASLPRPCTRSAVRASIWCSEIARPERHSARGMARPRRRRRAHRRDEAVPARQPAPGHHRVRPGQGPDSRDAVALHELKMPTIMLWPNVDAGPRHRLRHADVPREGAADYIRFYKNFPIETYVRLMLLCGLRGREFERTDSRGGIPRRAGGEHRHPQMGRDRGPNVIDVACDRAEIAAGIRRQLAHGRFPSDALYGDGKAAAASPTCWRARRSVQKRLVFTQPV